MSKELEAIKNKIEEAYKQLWHEREYAYDSKVCSKGKGWAEAIQHYDNIGRNLLEVKRILDDLITKYETIDNANPSEALKDLKCLKLHISARDMLGETNKKIALDICNDVEKALLKAQEPKQYLKWEDLEPFEEDKEIFGLLNGNKYTLHTYKDSKHKYVLISLNDINMATLCDMFKQDIDFFNDLHLEVVENE